jgi:hypothetical protein
MAKKTNGHILTAEDHAPYALPLPTFGPCPDCGQFVLLWTWMGEAKRWVREDPVRTPCLGLEHSVAEGTCTPLEGANV